MFHRRTIAYRGARYEIGRGPGFYGIWAVGAPRSQPHEQWPETPEGWSAAWARFTGIEVPDAIAPVTRIGWPGRRNLPAGQRTDTADAASGVRRPAPGSAGDSDSYREFGSGELSGGDSASHRAFDIDDPLLEGAIRFVPTEHPLGGSGTR